MDLRAAQIAVHDGAADETYGTDSWEASKRAAFEAHLRALPRPTALLVDLGCFNGALTACWKPFAQRVIGVDFHPEALLRARARGLEVLEHDLSSPEPLPLATGTVDVVTCADVVEHLVDPAVLLREAKRLLRPDGALLLSTPNMGYWLSRLRLLVGRPPLCTNGVALDYKRDFWVDPSHLHVSLLSEWEGLLNREGFRVVATRGSHLRFGGRRRLLAHWVDALCDRFAPRLSLMPVVWLTPSL